MCEQRPTTGPVLSCQLSNHLPSICSLLSLLCAHPSIHTLCMYVHLPKGLQTVAYKPTSCHPLPGYVCMPSPQLSVIWGRELACHAPRPRFADRGSRLEQESAHASNVEHAHAHECSLSKHIYPDLRARLCLALTCEIKSGLSHKASG